MLGPFPWDPHHDQIQIFTSYAIQYHRVKTGVLHILFGWYSNARPSFFILNYDLLPSVYYIVVVSYVDEISQVWGPQLTFDSISIDTNIVLYALQTHEFFISIISTTVMVGLEVNDEASCNLYNNIIIAISFAFFYKDIMLWFNMWMR